VLPIPRDMGHTAGAGASNYSSRILQCVQQHVLALFSSGAGDLLV